MEENSKINGTGYKTVNGLIVRKSNRLIDIIPGLKRNPNSRKWKIRYRIYLEIEPEVREEVEAAERAEQLAWEAQQRQRANVKELKAQVRAMRQKTQS
jgi:hypothetical protein